MSHKDKIEISWYNVVKMITDLGYSPDGDLTVDISTKGDFRTSTNINDALNTKDLESVDFRLYLGDYHIYLYRYSIYYDGENEEQENYKFNDLMISENHSPVKNRLYLHEVYEFYHKQNNIKLLASKI